MNEHLSSDQISGWMAGEHTSQQERHVSECPECSAELARLEAALSLFRSSVRLLGDQQSSSKLQAAWTRDRSRPGFPHPLRWVLTVATLLIVAAIPVFQLAKDKQRKAELAKADAILMEQVDAEVSRAIPEPMEPLIKLVSWNLDPKGDKRIQ